MSAATDLTTVAWVFKRDYSTRAVADMSGRDHPLWNDIPKEGGFVGEAHYYAMRYQNDQGISGTFANARANAKAMSGKQLAASRKPKFGIITLKGEALAAASADKGSFLRLVNGKSDGIIKEVGDSLAFDLFRGQNGGSGERGVVGSIAGNVITLSGAGTARNFKINMTVGGDDTATGLSPRVGTSFVTAVNIKDNSVTLNSVAAIAGLQAGDILFRDGDPGTCMEGLAVLTPLTAPVYLSDSFRGIDRGSYPELLAGSRIDDTNTSPEENIGLLGVQIGMNGQEGRAVYSNPINVFKIARRMNAKVMYQEAGGTVKWGFQFISIETPAGVLKVVSDPDCPLDRNYVVNHEAHYLKHLYGLPHIIDDDGNMNLRVTDEDAIEGRVRGWVNYIQLVPGDFGVCSS